MSNASRHPGAPRVTRRAAVLGLVAAPWLRPSPASAQREVVVGERAVESRLLAPCCWTQTLDLHESPLADSLRAEVRARLRAGERPDAIEADLVSRFGARMRAVPSGFDPRGSVLRIAAGVTLAAAGAAALTVRRWTRARPVTARPSAAPLSDAENARIDDALAALDR